MWLRCSGILASAVFLLHCDRTQYPYFDAADPLTVALENKSDKPLYLSVTATHEVVGAALTVTPANADAVALASARTCGVPLCGGACAVEDCAPRVREMSANSVFLANWDGLLFGSQTHACSGNAAETACALDVRAARGRYLVRVCFGRGVQPSDPAGSVQRLAGAENILLGAKLVDEVCTEALDVGYPSYDVRYRLLLQ